MKIFFSTEDLQRLKTLSETELYHLNNKLVQVTCNVKRLCMADENLILQLVKLAETAAKEVACRKHWEPILSDGKYSTTGVTYETPEYRSWLRENRQKNTGHYDICDLLLQFSFGEDILSLSTV